MTSLHGVAELLLRARFLVYWRAPPTNQNASAYAKQPDAVIIDLPTLVPGVSISMPWSMDFSVWDQNIILCS